MIWSERRNFCFIHIPKTGGSAIAAAYNKVMLLGDVMLGGPQFAELLQPIFQQRFGVHKHSRAAEVSKAVGGERFAQAFSFAVIRGPASRLVSYYKWLRKPDEGGLNNVEKRLRTITDFAEFAREAGNSFPPQSDFVMDASRNRLAVTKLLRFEHLDHDWRTVCQPLGLDLPLPIANKSPSIPVSIGNEAEAIIRQAYGQDYDLIEEHLI
jgi:hypothetical protein